MSVQVKVGIFALLGVMGVLASIYMIKNLGLTANGYKIAIHFFNTVGLQVGSGVQLSGVDVGQVDDIYLNKDQTATVVCTIRGQTVVYRESIFTVTTSLTGQTTLTIVPPRNLALATVLEHGILEEDQQPLGQLPMSLQDLATEGAQQLKELDKTLKIVNTELPLVARKLNDVADHTDKLVTHSDAAVESLRQELTNTVASLDATINTANRTMTITGRNVDELTGTLDATVKQNQRQLNELVTNLATSSRSMNETMTSLRNIATDPRFKDNVIQTTSNIRDASERLKQTATDIQSITGDKNVQSTLRGAIYDLSSAIAKADDILGGLSSATAHGVTASGSPQPVPGAGPPVSTPPRGQRFPGRGLASNLLQTQIRETYTGKGGGPESDLNVVLLPRARQHATIGVNDLGYSSTYNFLIDSALSPRLTVSGGLLYSNLGAKAVYQQGRWGLDLRAYDPKHPKLDAYGTLNLSPRLELFYGERHVIGPNKQDHQPAFGIQGTY